MRASLKVFIGWDSKEPLAWSVLAHSILTRASCPVEIIPLTRRALQGIYTRERGPSEATEFSLTRFLVPYLSHYEGVSIFMDSDMLCQVDLAHLGSLLEAAPEKAIYCCQHEYVPKALVKFDGHEQTKYPRKNWSSFMVFRNAQCRALTPDYVNRATGLQLHRFLWVGDDAIGALPLEWNWLVGEYPENPSAKILHYTNGTPCFADYATGDHAQDWWDEYHDMLKPLAAQAIEGVA